MMLIGHAFNLGALALLLTLGLAGVSTPLAFSLPLILLGLGHGFLVPPALVGTVSLLPALAGAAAAVAGLAQQMVGAAGGNAVGLLHHEGAVNLGWLMLGFALCSAVAQGVLVRGRRG
jgi:DHA1 family bicyclomycin/chloramphenicol resistance-like MFS transporter